jgi:hypothetical protein
VGILFTPSGGLCFSGVRMSFRLIQRDLESNRRLSEVLRFGIRALGALAQVLLSDNWLQVSLIDITS